MSRAQVGNTRMFAQVGNKFESFLQFVITRLN